MATTAFAVKEKLFELLTEDETFLESTMDGEHPLEVHYNYRGKSTDLPREVLWLGDIEWDDEYEPAFGANSREEIYNIVMVIEVHHEGFEQKESNDRAEYLMQALETVIRDPRWTGLPSIRTMIKPNSMSEGRDPEGFGTVLILLLRVTARI